MQISQPKYNFTRFESSLSALTIEIFASNTIASNSSIIINGQTISVVNEGRIQIVDPTSYSIICEGEGAFTLAPGTYIVINSTTGEFWDNVIIRDATAPSLSTPRDPPLSCRVFKQIQPYLTSQKCA